VSDTEAVEACIRFVDDDDDGDDDAILHCRFVNFLFVARVLHVAHILNLFISQTDADELATVLCVLSKLLIVKVAMVVLRYQFY